jgi:hypothetical protein
MFLPHGKARPPLTITLRADSPSGVSLGGVDTLEPGETKAVEYHLATSLLATGRATIAESGGTIDERLLEESPIEVSTPDAPAVSTPERKPRRRR